MAAVDSTVVAVVFAPLAAVPSDPATAASLVPVIRVSGEVVSVTFTAAVAAFTVAVLVAVVDTKPTSLVTT